MIVYFCQQRPVGQPKSITKNDLSFPHHSSTAPPVLLGDDYTPSTSGPVGASGLSSAPGPVGALGLSSTSGPVGEPGLSSILKDEISGSGRPMSGPSRAVTSPSDYILNGEIPSNTRSSNNQSELPPSYNQATSAATSSPS